MLSLSTQDRMNPGGANSTLDLDSYQLMKEAWGEDKKKKKNLMNQEFRQKTHDILQKVS